MTPRAPDGASRAPGMERALSAELAAERAAATTLLAQVAAQLARHPRAARSPDGQPPYLADTARDLQAAVTRALRLQDELRVLRSTRRREGC